MKQYLYKTYCMNEQIEMFGKIFYSPEGFLRHYQHNLLYIYWDGNHPKYPTVIKNVRAYTAQNECICYLKEVVKKL